MGVYHDNRCSAWGSGGAENTCRSEGGVVWPVVQECAVMVYAMALALALVGCFTWRGFRSRGCLGVGM